MAIKKRLSINYNALNILITWKWRGLIEVEEGGGVLSDKKKGTSKITGQAECIGGAAVDGHKEIVRNTE